MTNLKNSSPGVGAVVVTYQPEIAMLENVRLLAAQVDVLIVVDNGMSEVCRMALESQLIDQIELIKHPENLGIAAGFNTGIQRLVKTNCEFVFTFDQDSRVPSDFIQGMVKSFHAAEQEFGQVGMLMPIWHDSASEPVVRESLGLTEVFQGISSGTVYRTRVFAELGEFAEEYFIDGVDTEFCLRCQTSGWRVIQNPSFSIAHSLGTKMSIQVFGLVFSIVVHSAFRKYFMARNRILNYRKYGLRNLRWFFADFSMFSREIFHLLVYENQKSTKLWYTLIGIQDGILNRTGKINSSLE